MTAGEHTGEDAFKPGDHLRVRRSAVHSHHGIYVGEGRVVEFGGNWRDKPAAAIQETSLEEFQGLGRAEVVRHDTAPMLAGWMPTALPADECVERANFLLSTAERGRYNLVGHNCEHAATWCATGFPESHQVRVGLYLNLVRSTGTMMLTSWFVRRSRHLPSWIPISTALAFLVTTQYHLHQRRFVLEIDRAWRAYRAERGDA